jgi:hypothetical protein
MPGTQKGPTCGRTRANVVARWDEFDDSRPAATVHDFTPSQVKASPPVPLTPMCGQNGSAEPKIASQHPDTAFCAPNKNTNQKMFEVC